MRTTPDHGFGEPTTRNAGWLSGATAAGTTARSMTARTASTRPTTRARSNGKISGHGHCGASLTASAAGMGRAHPAAWEGRHQRCEPATDVNEPTVPAPEA